MKDSDKKQQKKTEVRKFSKTLKAEDLKRIRGGGVFAKLDGRRPEKRDR